MSESKEVWQRHLGDAEPVAHLLRDRFADRWVRFHSLPESKRYAETEDEMGVVLERHNRVISRLSAGEKSLTLLTTEYSNSALPSRCELADKNLVLGAQPWRSVPMHELSDNWEEPTYWHIFASAVQRGSDTLDSLFRLTAEDCASNVMLLSTRGWLYHPYDGGADVIAPTQDERKLLASEFSAWLSNHPLGL